MFHIVTFSRRHQLSLITLMVAAFLLGTVSVGAAEPVTWDLWPEGAPGGIKDLGPEIDTTKDTDDLIAGRRIIKLHNVSVPQLTIYKPDAAIDTGTAVVIAPGGGFWILAMDLEGTEIAEWLNTLGVTSIVLKYRVPGSAHNPEKVWLSAAQDGQRAMSLVRGRAKEIGINPERIGIMGFSAGGMPVTATAMMQKRLYLAVDKYDEVSFRPDFAAPIYAGGLRKDSELQALVDLAKCPPYFMVITSDDRRPVEVAQLYIALMEAGVSAELHIYESGGHGYGLRKTEQPITSWNDRMADWMRQMKFLSPSSK
jgi:acetyl esterase/lipase